MQKLMQWPSALLLMTEVDVQSILAYLSLICTLFFFFYMCNYVLKFQVSTFTVCVCILVVPC